MSSQIFRDNIPKNILFDFLKENSTEKSNYYFFFNLNNKISGDFDQTHEADK